MRDRLASEAGLTIAEVMVAALLAVLGAIGVLGMTDAASRSTYRAEQSQVVANKLQAELEHVRQLPFSAIATTAAPVHSAATTNPSFRVNGTNFALNRDGSNTQALVYNGRTLPGATSAISGGTMNAGPVNWSSGDVSGQIYRYVVAPGVPANCAKCVLGDLRRVVIAATVTDTASGGVRLYQEVQSDVIDPDADSGDALPGSGGGSSDKTLSTFYLTDTTCDKTARDAITAANLTHNTRGHCTDGIRTGTTKGAPDLMTDDPAPGAAALWDYSSDVNPATAPTADVGLSIRRTESADGCTLAPQSGSTLDFPSSEANLAARPWHQKEHMWLTEELLPAFRTVNSFDATLQLWTKTVHGASYGGRICVYVFKRIVIQGTGAKVDVMATNAEASPATSFTFTRATWPNAWTEVAVPIKALWASNALTPYNIQGQPRLGIAIQLERAGTDAQGLEFLYDHTSFPSRVEVQTPTGTTIIPP